MENTHQILELFPTPVYVDNLDPKFSNLISWFDKQEMYTDKDPIDAPNYGYRSKDSYILNKKECGDLREFILNKALKFGKMMGYECKNYKLSQSWISHKLPGQHHVMHSHSNSLISGVFYYGSMDENTPIIEFHKASVSINSCTLKPKHSPNSKYKFSHESVTIPPSPGLLLLFPSFLLHSVPVNDTNTIRKSLAFNIIPKEGFGSEQELTELKL